MNSIKIALLPALHDNYVPIIYDPAQLWAMVVDPPEAQLVTGFMREHNLNLTHILNTHHHPDHVGGNLELKKPSLISRLWELTKIKHASPGLTQTCHQGETLLLTEGDVAAGDDPLRAEVFFLPGHTLGHCAYYMPQLQAVFSGDVLFSCGCGRLFEGRPDQMWQSLLQLRELPDNTQVYCAHEYTLSNCEFALSLFPDNDDLLTFHRQTIEKRKNLLPTVPTTIGIEKKINPFLRADHPEVAQALKIEGVSMEGASGEEVFTQLRKLKDQY